MQILLIHLSQDCYSKARVTKSHPEAYLKIEKSFQEYFDYIQTISFDIVCDLKNAFEAKYLNNLSTFFSEPFLFVNENAKKRLLKDYPKIYENFLIE